MRSILPDFSEFTRLPPAAPGMKIGLFGGSFNPPHEGHRLVAREVLRRLGLDAVWWLVTPGNPLKDHSHLAPLAERIMAARAMVENPRIKVTGFEAAHGFRYTYDSLHYLLKTHRGVHFVWIMGADNLVNFHRWERWREIAARVPIAIYTRPGSSRTATTSRAATVLGRYRLDEVDARLLPTMKPPAWVYLNGLMSALSSTAIRNARSADKDQAKSDP